MVSKHKKILIVMLACILLLSMFLPMISFANDGTYFDTVSVMEDLLSSPDFNIYHYGYSETEELSILNFLEYCYSPFANCREYYGLYLYLYNPQNIELKSTGHSVQLAVTVGDTTQEYSNYDLKLLSSSSGDRKNLFHKFKVLGAEEIAKQVKSEKRIYNISGIELNTANGIKDNGIGGIWSFTGYAKGYSPSGDHEATLKSDYCKDIKRIELDVKDTFYRLPGFNANGSFHVDTLSSVYFAVDNKILSEYGNLHAVKAEWFETKTAPIIIVKDKQAYDSMLPYLGKVIDPLTTIDRPIYGLGGPLSSLTGLNYYWNSPFNPYVTSQLVNLFYENVYEFPADYALSGDRLKQHWTSYNASNVNPPVGKNGYSGDLFDKTVDPGRIYGKNAVYIDNSTTFDLTAYSYSSGWAEFWRPLLGIAPDDNSILGKIYPIRKVSKADLSLESDKLSEKLFVDKNDITEFKSYSTDAIARNQTPYLFSFAVTDYFNSSISLFKAGSTATAGLVSTQTVFLDFDIIELKFLKDGKYKTIPVVSNPIDIAADLTINDSVVEKDGLPDWLKWVLLIVGIILLVILLPVIIPILGAIVKLLLFIICLPFKLIGYIFKSFKKE